MDVGWLLYVLGGLFVVWNVVVWAFAFNQELKLGWTKFDLKARMAIFILVMQLQGVVHQVTVYAYHLVYGATEGRKFGHRTMCRFYGWFSPLLFGPYQAEGLENLPPKDETCIYVANHQSSVDFTLYYALPHTHFGGLCAVAKNSIVYMPGFGAMTVLCGGVMIRRGKKGTMAQLVDQSTERLASGINVGLFPQGTRSVPGPNQPPLPFKKGFAVMAAKTKARVVPMTFLYASDFLSATRDPKTCAAKVIVHPAVTVKSDKPEDIDAAVKAVEDMILAPVFANQRAAAAVAAGEGKKTK